MKKGIKHIFFVLAVMLSFSIFMQPIKIVYANEIIDGQVKISDEGIPYDIEGTIPQEINAEESSVASVNSEITELNEDDMQVVSSEAMETGKVDKKDFENTSVPQPLETTANIERDNFGNLYSIGQYSASMFGLNPIAAATDSYYDQLDEESKQVYDLIYAAYENGPVSSSVQLAFSKIFTNMSFTISNNTYSISDDSKAVISEQIPPIIDTAYLALVYDHPEMNWLISVGVRYGWSMRPINPSADYTSGDVEVPYITFLTSQYVTDNGDKAAMDQAVQNIADRLSAEYQMDMISTIGEKIRAIHDYICDTVAYTQAADYNTNRLYQTPYSAMINHETVCAGYAKMFKILCNYYDIPCVLVSGYGVTNMASQAGEAHMWNYVQIGKSWYAVDCTWDDQPNLPNGMSYDYFLVGAASTGEYARYPFADTHIESGDWDGTGNYIFQYPLLSENAYDGMGEQTEKIELYGHSVSLDGTIGLNFYMYLPDYVKNNQNAYMQFVYESGDTYAVNVQDIINDEVRRIVVNDVTYYSFGCPIAAKEMSDQISAQLVMPNGDGAELSDVYTYSVREYANSIIENSDLYSDEIEMVKAMLNYGSFAQEYFSYYPENLAFTDSEYREATCSLSAEIFDEFKYSKSGSEEGIRYVGSKLTLDSDTTVKLYFKVNGYTPDSPDAISCTGNSTDVYETMSLLEDGIYSYIESPFSVPAHRLGESFTYRIGNITIDNFSPMSYAYTVMKMSGHDELKNLMKAMYQYNQKAIEYFDTVA